MIDNAEKEMDEIKCGVLWTRSTYESFSVVAVSIAKYVCRPLRR